MPEYESLPDRLPPAVRKLLDVLAEAYPGYVLFTALPQHLQDAAKWCMEGQPQRKWVSVCQVAFDPSLLTTEKPDEIPDGEQVTALTLADDDRELPPREVTGVLERRYVETLQYTQHLVNGPPVDPGTIQRVEPVARVDWVPCVPTPPQIMLAPDGHDRLLQDRLWDPPPSDQGGPSDDPDTLLSPAKLADHLGIPKSDAKGREALRKRLESWRKANLDGGWIEAKDPKPREPRYLYPLGKVWPLIQDLKPSG